MLAARPTSRSASATVAATSTSRPSASPAARTGSSRARRRGRSRGGATSARGPVVVQERAVAPRARRPAGSPSRRWRRRPPGAAISRAAAAGFNLAAAQLRDQRPVLGARDRPARGPGEATARRGRRGPRGAWRAQVAAVPPDQQRKARSDWSTIGAQTVAGLLRTATRPTVRGPCPTIPRACCFIALGHAVEQQKAVVEPGSLPQEAKRQGTSLYCVPSAYNCLLLSLVSQLSGAEYRVPQYSTVSIVPRKVLWRTIKSLAVSRRQAVAGRAPDLLAFPSLEAWNPACPLPLPKAINRVEGGTDQAGLLSNARPRPPRCPRRRPRRRRAGPGTALRFEQQSRRHLLRGRRQRRRSVGERREYVKWHRPPPADGWNDQTDGEWSRASKIFPLDQQCPRAAFAKLRAPR